jgi:hypothetical protein
MIFEHTIRINTEADKIFQFFEKYGRKLHPLEPAAYLFSLRKG